MCQLQSLDMWPKPAARVGAHSVSSPDQIFGIPHVYEVFADHVKLLQCVRVLWIGHIAQVLHSIEVVPMGKQQGSSSPPACPRRTECPQAPHNMRIALCTYLKHF